MLTRLLLVSAFLAPFLAHADEKFCAVEDMHCEDCVAMVKDKVCSDKSYSTCEIKIIDEKKQLGQLHLITKDASAKIDQKAIDTMMKPLGYGIKTCQAQALTHGKKAKAL